MSKHTPNTPTVAEKEVKPTPGTPCIFCGKVFTRRCKVEFIGWDGGTVRLWAHRSHQSQARAALPRGTP